MKKTIVTTNNVNVNLSNEQVTLIEVAPRVKALKVSRRFLALANKEYTTLSRVLKTMASKACFDNYQQAIESIATRDGKPLFTWANIRSPKAFLETLADEQFMRDEKGKKTRDCGLWSEFTVYQKDDKGKYMKDADGNKIPARGEDGKVLVEHRLQAVHTWTPNKVWRMLVQCAAIGLVKK